MRISVIDRRLTSQWRSRWQPTQYHAATMLSLSDLAGRVTLSMREIYHCIVWAWSCSGHRFNDSISHTTVLTACLNMQQSIRHGCTRSLGGGGSRDLIMNSSVDLFTAHIEPHWGQAANHPAPIYPTDIPPHGARRLAHWRMAHRRLAQRRMAHRRKAHRRRRKAHRRRRFAHRRRRFAHRRRRFAHP